MFSIMELPRVDGLIVGEFKVRHSSSTFALDAYDFRFVDGVTESAAPSRAIERLHAAYGNDVTFVPCDRASGLAAIAWMTQYCVPQERIDVVAAELDVMFPAETDPAVEPAPADGEPEPDGDGVPMDGIEPTSEPEPTESETSPEAKKGKRGK